MRAVVLKDGVLEWREAAQRPEPAGGEALIGVRRAGICGTDFQLLQGYYDFAGIPGHEFVGEVIEAPDNPDWVGRRVVGDINVNCGECTMCRHGRHTHCTSRRVLGIRDHDGAFAQCLTLPVCNLYQVPDAVSDDAAAFAEPVAAAARILEQVMLAAERRVLVVGAGRLGQLIARTLATTGCSLEVVARHERQRVLLEGAGIASVAEDAVAEASYDLVVDATGAPGGVRLACAAVRPRGAVVLKSTYRGEAALNLSRLVVDEVSLIGSRCGPMDRALELLASGAVDPLPLIEACYPLREFERAFEHAARPGANKVLLDPR